LGHVLGLSPLVSRALAVTLGLKLNNQGMVHQPIDGGDGHHVIGKNRIPLAEGLIGGD
jgi:hypothetical protein